MDKNEDGQPTRQRWRISHSSRTPDASRLPGVSEARKAFGVRSIYRRFSSLAETIGTKFRGPRVKSM
jgi:hypothetical protein